jgi:hypothetical protein
VATIGKAASAIGALLGTGRAQYSTRRNDLLISLPPLIVSGKIF